MTTLRFLRVVIYVFWLETLRWEDRFLSPSIGLIIPLVRSDVVSDRLKIQLMACIGNRSSPSPSSRSYAKFWLPLNMSLTLIPAFDCRCVWLNALLAPNVCIWDLRLSACMDRLLTSSACRTSLPIVSFRPNTGVPPVNEYGIIIIQNCYWVSKIRLLYLRICTSEMQVKQASNIFEIKSRVDIVFKLVI